MKSKCYGMTAGGYNFFDFIKIGVPLQVSLFRMRNLFCDIILKPKSRKNHPDEFAVFFQFEKGNA